jgi:hypothetical protein
MLAANGIDASASCWRIASSAATLDPGRGAERLQRDRVPKGVKRGDAANEVGLRLRRLGRGRELDGAQSGILRAQSRGWQRARDHQRGYQRPPVQ